MVSPDTQFLPIGDKSHIPYSKLFWTYKEFLTWCSSTPAVTRLLAYWDEVVFKGMDPTKVQDVNEEGNYDTEIDALLANLKAFEFDEDLDSVDDVMGEALGDGMVVSDVVDNPLEPEVLQPEVINPLILMFRFLRKRHRLVHIQLPWNPWSRPSKVKEIPLEVREASTMGW